MSPIAAHSWPEVLSRPDRRRSDLTADQTAWAMGEILAGEATPVQIAGFAVALRAKGETIDELEGLVAAMYEHATPLVGHRPGARRRRHRRRPVDVGEHLHDGRDRRGRRRRARWSSTATAPPRPRPAPPTCSRRSASGSTCPPTSVARVGEEAGITFCFAAAFHPALRHAAVARRELGVGTTFNFLGPLANPAKPEAQAIGCADARMAPLMAGVFARRGVDAWVFRGDDGLDELTTTTTSQVWAVDGRRGRASSPSTRPASASAAGRPRVCAAGDAAYNAEVVRRLVAGEPGPVRDAVVLNAGAALAVHAAEPGTHDERLAAGIERAAAALDSGAARCTARPVGRGQLRALTGTRSARNRRRSANLPRGRRRCWSLACSR